MAAELETTTVLLPLFAHSSNVTFCHPQSLASQERKEDQLKSGDYSFLMSRTISRIYSSVNKLFSSSRYFRSEGAHLYPA